jgi:hypothetical protein
LNTSVQIKTHSTTSAKNKNTHILRNSEAYKNPNILVIQKNDIAFKKEKEILQKEILQQEENRKYELKKINSSINTYKKRLELAADEKQKEKLEKKLKIQIASDVLEDKKLLKNWIDEHNNLSSNNTKVKKKRVQ